MRLCIACFLLAFPVAVYASSSSLSITTGGMSIHGEEIDPELAQQMPNRIGDDGKIVYHPTELAITYYSGLLQMNGLWFKDSFNNPAAYLGAGLSVAFPFKNLSLGGTAGIYTRKIEEFTYSTGESVRVVSGPVLVETKGFETIPMAFLTASWAMPVQDNLYFVLDAASNYALTHFTAGFMYRISY